MSRSARVQRTTKESDVLVELELDGTGVTEIDTGVPFFDHMLAQLGKHGGLRPRRAHDGRPRGRRAPHGRGHLARARARRCARRSATRPASGGSATRSCRWTRRSCRWRSTCPGRPYLVHDEPEIVELIGTVRHDADQAHLGVDLRRVAHHAARARARRPQRAPHRRGAVQGGRPRAARRGRARRARGRRPEHEGIAVVPCGSPCSCSPAS